MEVQLNILVQWIFNIMIQEKHYDVHALYSSEVKYDLVLGFDFLKKNSLKIDFTHVRLGSKSSCFVKAHETFLLEPNSETTIWGDVDSSLKLGDGLVSCSSVMPHLDLFVAHAIVSVTPSLQQVPVRILNPSQQQKKVKKNTKIAQFRLLHPDEQIHEVTDCLPSVMQKANAAEKFSNIPDDFRKMFDLQDSTFTPADREELMNMLWEYEDIFAQPGKPLGRTDLIKFHIDLKEDAKRLKPDLTEANHESKRRFQSR